MRHPHDLKVEMRDVFRCVPRRADESDRVTLRQGHPGYEIVAVMIEVRVVVDDARVGVRRIHRVAAGAVPADAQDSPVVGGEDWRTARRENVDGAMSARSVSRLVE